MVLNAMLAGSMQRLPSQSKSYNLTVRGHISMSPLRSPLPLTATGSVS